MCHPLHETNKWNNTFIAWRIGYVIVWSPPSAKGTQPFFISDEKWFLISWHAFGRLYRLRFTSPTSATWKESNGDAPVNGIHKLIECWLQKEDMYGRRNEYMDEWFFVILFFDNNEWINNQFSTCCDINFPEESGLCPYLSRSKSRTRSVGGSYVQRHTNKTCS